LEEPTNDMVQIAFSVYENKDVFALLLGSGLSRAAEIPTGWEITVDLIRRIGHLQGVENHEDWPAWYQKIAGKKPDYSELLEQVTSKQAERRAILNRYIEPTDAERNEGKKIPTAAHHAIARLVRSGYIKVIVTTNFDRLMENALREQDIEPTIVSSVHALEGAEPMAHCRCFLLKLHGDYKDSRILNTESELSCYEEQYDELLKQIFNEYGLIVCGWSGEWDDALRKAFLRASSRRYQTYWGARGDLGDRAQRLVNHRRATVIQIADADSFFSRLQEHVETLEQVQPEHPRTIELLVNSTKRFLAKSEYRIQFNDLFTQETENLIVLLGGNDLAPPSAWDATILQKYLSRYEATTQPLATMCIALGRWGEGIELSLVVEIIRALWADALQIQRGIHFYRDLRSYPAVLVFTAYALGLTRAERYNVLHEFFCSRINKKPEGTVRLVDGLFLWAWEGSKNEKLIKGLANHPIPLSEYLFKLFSDWGKPYLGLTSNFELVFDHFEMLGSLVHLEKHDHTRISEKLEQGGYEWMPVGRLSLREEFDDRFALEQLKDEKIKQILIQAGFAKGEVGFIEWFINNFESLAKQVRWNMLLSRNS